MLVEKKIILVEKKVFLVEKKYLTKFFTCLNFSLSVHCVMYVCIVQTAAADFADV